MLSKLPIVLSKCTVVTIVPLSFDKHSVRAFSITGEQTKTPQVKRKKLIDLCSSWCMQLNSRSWIFL